MSNLPCLISCSVCNRSIASDSDFCIGCGSRAQLQQLQEQLRIEQKKKTCTHENLCAVRTYPSTTPTYYIKCKSCGEQFSETILCGTVVSAEKYWKIVRAHEQVEERRKEWRESYWGKREERERREKSRYFVSTSTSYSSQEYRSMPLPHDVGK